MPHEAPLVTTLAAAWALGVLAHRLGVSPIVGYLLAGVVIGPHTPGFIGDVALARLLLREVGTDPATIERESARVRDELSSEGA